MGLRAELPKMLLRGTCRKTSQLGKMKLRKAVLVFDPLGVEASFGNRSTSHFVFQPGFAASWHNASLKEINTSIVMDFVYLATEIVWKGQKCHI